MLEARADDPVEAGRATRPEVPGRRRATPSIDVVGPDELDPLLLVSWRQIQARHEHLASPYLAPEFTLAVSRVRPDVEVAVLHHDGAPVGFFPFQRGGRGVGRPVAFGISDVQAVVAGPDVVLDADRLLAGCGLRRYVFDHLLAGRPGFDRCATPASSPVVDLRQGYDRWYAERRAAHPQGFGQLARKRRRLDRPGAGVRYESHTDDPAVLERLLELKSAQYRRTGVADVFRAPWTVELLRALQRTRVAGFEGRVSVLWVGDEPAAVHLGMATEGVWHYWFPTYDDRFARHSPGLVLLLEMVRDADRRGHPLLDLGRGDARFKREFANASVPLLVGSVGRPGPGARLGRRLAPVAGYAAGSLRRTPLAAPLRGPARAARAYRKRRRLG